MTGLRAIASGTLWVVAARWTIRGIGLISTVILARLLAPAEFGVVAMAMFVTGLLEVFGDTGLVLYLIRHPDPQRGHFDTVWTLRLLVGAALALALLLLAPLGAAFFKEPLVAPAIRVLALRPLLLGLENPGIVLFRKDMVFSKDFEFLVLNKLAGFVLTVGLAVLLRSHWALIAGILAGSAVSTLQSYRMHPYRPRLDLSHTRDAWGFSGWMLAQNVLAFANTRIDELVVGRMASAASMGQYHVAADVATSPVQEVAMPLSRVLFPALSRLLHDPQALAATVPRVLSAVAIIAVSLGAGVALVAGDFVRVVLGPHWLAVVPLVRILAASAAVTVLSYPLAELLNATGQVRLGALLTLARQALLLAAMVPAALYWGTLEAVALARAGCVVTSFVGSALVYAKVLRLPAASAFACLLRPLAAAAAMAGAVLLTQAAAPDLPALRLPLAALVGAATFALALWLLWRLAGRPDGAERDLLAFVASRRRQVGALPRPQ
jgi:O-antigen/teichoic acid export membrane protein